MMYLRHSHLGAEEPTPPQKNVTPEGTAAPTVPAPRRILGFTPTQIALFAAAAFITFLLVRRR